MEKLKSNKSLFIALEIIVLIIIGVIIFYQIDNKNCVDKFSLCTIKDYSGKEIEQYQSNNIPFIIDEYNSEAKVKVNGKEYNKGLGFYKSGVYTIEITLGEKTEKSKVKIEKIKENEKNEYNIFITAETLPTFFASFDMIKQKEIPAYVWYQREDTLSIENLKEMFRDVKISDHIGKKSFDDIQQYVIPEIKTYVLDTLKKDENAHFNVYVTAEYYWLEIAALETLGLSEERLNIIMYSCGTIDYDVDYNITLENAYEIFNDKRDDFIEKIDKARSNLYSNDTHYTFLREGGTGRFMPDYTLINSLRENVTYYLQFPELVKFQDERVAREMKNAHMKKIVANEAFDELSQSQKEQFFKCINLNKEEFDDKYFNVEGGKYLIITGTNPYYGKYKKASFEDMISQTVEKYGNEYSILYKPHPMATPNETATKFLNSKNIKVLPARMPMEAISFIYKDLKLGGFASSLYMSVDKGSTLFFYSPNSESLVEPLNVLYEELFKDAEFIQPRK